MKWGERLFGVRKTHEQPARADIDLDRLILEGNALEDGGEWEAALAAYRRAAVLAPASPRPHVNIGNALKLLGRVDEAITAQRTALELDPVHPGARCNLGALLWLAGDGAGAERELRAALALKPELHSAAILLADVLDKSGRTADAEQVLRGVLAAEPAETTARFNLASMFLRQGRLDEVEDVAEDARSTGADPASMATLLGIVYSRTGRAREAEPLFRAALARPELAREAISPHLFTLNLRDDLAAEEIFAEHRALGGRIDPSAPVRAVTPLASEPDPQRMLRIGYVSPDLRQHPVGLFIRPLLEHHDRARFRVHCYSNNAADDDVTRLLKQTDTQWRSIRGASDDAARELIRQDGIDILVDLAGHTADNRLAVFARRAAPVQATWLGYLNTTGVPAMDYRLCDRHTDPPTEAARWNTETLAHLPDSQWCYAPIYDVPLQPREKRSATVFGSFNQYAKVSDQCLAQWRDILAGVPDATLRIYGVPEGRSRERLRARLAHIQLPAERVEVRDRVGIIDYFRAIEDVDIALDAYPYNGGTTTFDTLWMGTPLVGLKGATSVARSSYSILTALGLSDLVAPTPQRYVEINRALASDEAWRAQLHRTLRERMVVSALMDAPRFVRGLEDAYRRMWVTACQRICAS
jgi:predicted O-linked N-acetylglucosamine transferase (SPINDLY family)